MAAEQATYDLWKDGGAAKVALHAAVGASISGLTGGSVAGGALSAGASEAAAPLTAGQTKLVQELASTVIGAAGAAIGGGSASAGGATALAGQQFNRELHASELAALNKAKEGKAPEEQQTLNNAACLAIQCWITGTADGSNKSEANYNATIRDQVEAWAKANPEALAAASATLGATGLFVSTPGEIGRDAIVQARVDYHGGQAAHLAAEKLTSQAYLGDLDMQLTGRAQVSAGQSSFVDLVAGVIAAANTKSDPEAQSTYTGRYLAYMGNRRVDAQGQIADALQPSKEPWFDGGGVDSLIHTGSSVVKLGGGVTALLASPWTGTFDATIGSALNQATSNAPHGTVSGLSYDMRLPTTFAGDTAVAIGGFFVGEQVSGAKPARPGIITADEATTRLPNRYLGVQEASAHLKALGVSRGDRVQVLQSFDVDAIAVRLAGESEYGLRFYSDSSMPGGSYLFEAFPASRSSLAIKPEWSTMTGFKQFQIKPGATILEGPAAPQGSYLPGGQTQKYVRDWRSNLLESEKP